MHQKALQRAIEEAGGQAALASKIGRSQQIVWFWLNRAKKIPYEVAIDIEKAVGGKVKRDELRPDRRAA